MSAIRTVSTIARVEVRLLFRSWGFRIFAGIALGLLVLVMVTLTLSPYAALYFSRALSGAFPLIVVKLLTVLQGIMAVFITTEFLNRDRRQDATEVIYAHPFANASYMIGKFAGIFAVFAFLDAAVLLVAVVIHVFFAHPLFSASAYLAYLLHLNLPTLVFMIGLTMILGSLFRHPAVVYLLTLAYVFLSLVLLGPRFSFAFDGFAFHTPIFYSDFIGLGNLSEILPLRAAYVLLGLSFALGSTLLMKRLRQASPWNKAVGLLALAGVVSASVLISTRLHSTAVRRDIRAAMKAESRNAEARPAMDLQTCDLSLKPEGRAIAATADLTLANSGDAALQGTFLTLNPGFKVVAVTGPSGPLTFRRTRHLLDVDLAEPVPPGGVVRLSVSYAGPVDERFCYLDLDDAKCETPLKIWFLSIPKRFAVVRPDFVHLTPECGWYPRPGLPDSHLFPSAVRQNYARFTLSVEVPAGLTAVSQGIPTVEEKGRTKVFLFQPKTPLPQLSLTLGRYERKSIDVEGVRYALYILAGHDRFTPNLAEIKGELPQLIKQLKDGYEVLLGLNYPYEQLALVEVPVQVTSHDRLWTTAQEQVQPQIVFLPEMGAFSTGADFRLARAPLGGGPAGGAGVRLGGGAGQRAVIIRGGGQLGPKDLQRALFNRFVQANLAGTLATPAIALRPGPLGIRIETNSEARFNVFPNFLTYASRFGIGAWPLLDYALEAYLREKVSGQTTAPMRLALGSSNREVVNKFLGDHSLAEVLERSVRGPEPLSSVLEEKGKYLITFIRASLAAPDFDDRLIGFLKSRRFQLIRQRDVEEFIAAMGRLDLGRTIAAWYREKGLPGFLFDNIRSFRVIDREKTKFQIAFEVANPTDREGVIRVNLATRGSFGPRGGGAGVGLMGGPAAASESRTFLVPALTVKNVGIVLDQAAVMTSIDTTMSRNLPSVFTLPFSNQPPPPGAKPFDGESARPYVPAPPGTNGEYVVDNEDKEFKLPEKGRENWLRRSVRQIFVPEDEGQDPVAILGLANPPDEWQPVILQNFYGRFVRSAYVKKSGSGTNKVAWRTNLAEAGSYNIYFYNEGIGGPGRGGAMIMRGPAAGPGMAGPQPGGGQQPSAAPSGGQRMGPGMNAPRMQPGTRHFLVHHEDGVEEVVIDLSEARPGWTLIGSFRLPAGENVVELTDKNEGRFVLADAVKWVRER
jgi:ABC-type transport system involved in multi-copper enzyme maturation permease subunit